MAQGPQSGLSHCPGLHGPGVSTGVSRRPLEQLLAGPWSVVLPVFQRRYCWGTEQLRAWWADLLGRGKGSTACRTPDGRHSIGRLVFLDSSASRGCGSAGTRLTCLDGQQRLTTTMILLSALRDTALQLADVQAGSAVVTDNERGILGDICEVVGNALLLPSDDGEESSLRTKRRRMLLGRVHSSAAIARPAEGVTPTDFRLVPTWEDRESFTAVIMGSIIGSPDGGGCGGVSSSSDPNDDESLRRPAVASSCQLRAYQTFMALAAEELSSRELNTLHSRLSFLQSVAAKQLKGTSYMHITVEDESQAQQMFLWLQEAAIMAETLVYNPVPGVGLSVVDLVRNHLLSYFLSDRIQQESVYIHKWRPIEKALEDFQSPRDGDAASKQSPAPGIMQSRSLFHIAGDLSASERAIAMYMEERGSPLKRRPGAASVPKSIMIYRAFSEHLMAKVLPGTSDSETQLAVEELMDDIRRFAESRHNGQ